MRTAIYLALAVLASRPDVLLAAPRIVEPDWAMRPAGEDLAANYPEIATALGIEGYARISCDVAASGLLENCSVQKEAPRGFGFGAAALRMTPKFRLRPMQSDGKAVAGGDVQIPIRFVLPTPPVPDSLPSISPDRDRIDLARRLVAAQMHPDARKFFVRAKTAELRAKARSQSDPGILAAAIDALSSAALADAPIAQEDLSQIYASVLPTSELETHLAYYQTSAASAFLSQQAALASLHRRLGLARYAQVRWEANRLFCAKYDCRAEADFPSGRAPQGGPKMIYSPEWVQKADAAQVFRAYPAVAKTLAIEGWGGLVCRADHLGLLSGCRVAAESPAGLGFGAAALTLAPHYRLKHPGQDQSDSEVWLTMRFRQPPSLRSPVDYPGAAESKLILARQIAASEPLALNFAWSDEMWGKLREETPSGTVSVATLAEAEAAWRAAMKLENAASQEAVASFWASFMDEEQLSTLLAYRRTSTWNEFGGRQQAMRPAMEAAAARSNARILSKAREIFCRKHDCKRPRELRGVT